MSATDDMHELLGRLRTSSVVIRNLPENPGYNGSRLIIDDDESDRVANDIDDAVAAITSLMLKYMS